MIDFIRGILKFYFPSKRVPKVGELYCYDDDRNNPFKRMEIVIGKVRNDYISYSYILEDGSESNRTHTMKIIELNRFWSLVDTESR